jgi:hypothetical protein
MRNKTLYILPLFILVVYQCKVIKDSPEVSKFSSITILDSSSLARRPDIRLIDTLIIQGYLLDIERIKFKNYNSGSVIIDSLLFEKICYTDQEVDFYEHLLSEGALPILEVSIYDFPNIKWNLLNTDKQVSHNMITNVPDSVYSSKAFQRDTYLGTYQYKLGEYLNNKHKTYTRKGGYRVNTTKVKLSGFIMKVNRNIGLPFWSTTLESMVFDKHGELIVFVPMELYERLELDEYFYSNIFNCD